MKAIEQITIFKPNGEVYGVFPITNNCERSAKLMGDDYVNLKFNHEQKHIFGAFAYIVYNKQVFFLKEQYIPTPNGTMDGANGVATNYYTYDVKFVSVANMLDKFICYRHVVVNGENGGEWDEPEININGTLETLYVIVMGAIKQAAARIDQSWLFTKILTSIANNGANRANVKLTEGTKLLTFNFSGDNIANVCTTIANNFTQEDKKDTEWYLTPVDDTNYTQCTLHFTKCIGKEEDMRIMTDYTTEDKGKYTTGGLKKVEYAQTWSGIPEVFVPYGSDRNMTYEAVKGIDAITQMQSTFGKRLRLVPNTQYIVKDKDNNDVVLVTDPHGAIRNEYVSTGIEQVKFYDDIYPQGHFRVNKVDVRNKKQDDQIVPEYTIEAEPIDMNKQVLTDNEFYPIKIEEGKTLSVRFESGYLNGREFEIANKTRKDEGATTYSMKFTIVADGSIEDGTLIPSGNFIPYIGDEFALFNMKMPEVYITAAKQVLAQRAYDELVELQTKRPEVKCSADPVVFNEELQFGDIIKVKSELFNSEDEFVSRVIAYSYKLTIPNDMQFSLASAIMQGALSSLNDRIEDVTNVSLGLEQRSTNLSRRGWRDASEVAAMLDSITAEMMLVGNEKYQFSFTSGINVVVNNGTTIGINVGYGFLQHTQDPYIGYVQQGWWEIGAQEVTKALTEDGEVLISSIPDTPLYTYAKVANDKQPAKIVLTTDDRATEEEYLLLGILSSEFEGVRVFSRTNGFTAIEGGTITTEQVQDAGRNLIIDFSSNPPRIIARNGAEIIGNIRFKSFVDENGNNPLNIGGENLCPYEELAANYFPNDYQDSVVTKILCKVENGKKYIGTLGELVSTIPSGASEFLTETFIMLISNDDNINLSSAHHLRHYKWGEVMNINLTDYELSQADVLYLAIVFCNLDKVVEGAQDEQDIDSRMNIILNQNFRTGYYDEAREIDTMTARRIMIQQGEKATNYNTYYNHLTNALHGSTEMIGGLVMTNVLELKDENGKVKAGMSGLTDGVTLWSGGTYTDAIKQAVGQLKKFLPILLTKEGAGSRIGCFVVEDENSVYVENTQRTRKITFDTDFGITISNRNSENEEYKDKIHIHAGEIDRDAVSTNQINGGRVQVMKTLNNSPILVAPPNMESEFVLDELHDSFAITSSVSSIRVGIVDDLISTGTTTRAYSWRIIGVRVGLQSVTNGRFFQLGYHEGVKSSSIIQEAYTLNMSLTSLSKIPSGTYMLAVRIENATGWTSPNYKGTEFDMLTTPNATMITSVEIDGQLLFSSQTETAITEIASNGIMISSPHGAVQILNSEANEDLYVTMSGLPLSATKGGQLYQEDGFVKIK